jgi:hypothetical protein
LTCALRHQYVRPGFTAPNLAVHDGRIAELIRLSNMKVDFQDRYIGLQIDVGVGAQLKRKRLIEFDIGAINAGRDGCIRVH